MKDQQQPNEAPQASTRPSTGSLLDPSSPHHSLATFQTYALRTGLSTTSTVYTGTAYEYLTQSTLRPYGFELHRVGGRGDRGVDLLGTWQIPKLSASGEWKETMVNKTTQGQEQAGVVFEVETQPLKVMVQCKRLVGRHARIGPNLIRELDGALRGARHAPALFDALFPHLKTTSAEEEESGGGHQQQQPQPITSWTGLALGVLVGTRPATKGVVESMRRSSRGLVWIMMEEIGDDSTTDVVNGGDIDASSSSTKPEEAQLHNHDSQTQTQPSNPDPDPDPSPDPSPTGTTTPGPRGRVKQILWNQAASNSGLEGVDVVNRYDSQGREEIVLMRGGRVWGGGTL